MKLIISPRADYNHNACPRAVIMAVPKFWFRNCHRMVFYALIASLKHSVKNFDSKNLELIISPKSLIMTALRGNLYFFEIML